MTELFNQLQSAPPYVIYWLYWLGAVVASSLLLIAIREVRISLLFQIGNTIVGGILLSTFGVVRLLGLAHVLFWTPMLWYLWSHRARFDRPLLRVWFLIFIATCGASLLIDFVDVLRYLLGDRAQMQEIWELRKIE